MSSEPDGRGVRIPPGAFQMGSNDGAEDRRPVHTVFLDGLFIDRCPVTNGQFARFARETGYLRVPSAAGRVLSVASPSAPRSRAPTGGILKSLSPTSTRGRTVPWSK
jgi:formylglycine-generating enzyme required for sulfatase activity